MTIAPLDPARWKAKIDQSSLLSDSIFARYAYVDSWIEHEQASAVCLYADIAGSEYFYPFLMKPIPIQLSNKTANAITSVYGYGGLFTTAKTVDSDSLRKVNAAIDGWCDDSLVISEFVRQDHLHFGMRQLRHMEYSAARRDLLMDISGRDWRQKLPAHARRPVTRARAHGLTARSHLLSQGAEEFHALYTDTMVRCRAESYYFLPLAYFVRLGANLGNDAILMCIDQPGAGTVAAGLLLASGRTCVLHLTGSTATSSELGANDYLYFSALEWAEKHGFSLVLLGSGRRGGAVDGLYRFKCKYANHSEIFWIGMKTHDRETHASLREHWCRARGHEHASGSEIFQCYLLPTQ